MISENMQRFLNEHEVSVAKRIINIALANAADSFSKLAKTKVRLQHVEIPPATPDNDLKHLIDDNNQLYVLITEVKGDIPAESYLVFTEKSAGEIVKLIMHNANQQNTEIKEAILLETDNILTASVVSQFSNFFKVNLYGDVPGLYKWNKEKTEEILTEKMQEYSLRVSFKTSFITDGTEIHPEFIWIFTHSFIDYVKWLANDKIACDKLITFDSYVEEYIQ
jgi:chemotaxis protein CheY-P-specific phosphatase CheC